jgi:hypothetical protein
MTQIFNTIFDIKTPFWKGKNNFFYTKHHRDKFYTLNQKQTQNSNVYDSCFLTKACNFYLPPPTFEESRIVGLDVDVEFFVYIKFHDK